MDINTVLKELREGNAAIANDITYVDLVSVIRFVFPKNESYVNPYADFYYVSSIDKNDFSYNDYELPAGMKITYPVSEILNEIKKLSNMENDLVFIVDQIKNGRAAIYNDGTYNDLVDALRFAFPNDDSYIAGDGKYYTITEDKDKWIGNNTIPMYYITYSAKTIANKLHETKIKNKFKFGDRVFVSNDELKWYEQIFVCETNDENKKYGTVDIVESYLEKSNQLRFFKYIKKAKVKVSKEEIAKWKNCNLEDIEII